MDKGHRNDTKHAKPLIKKLARHYNPSVLYADRGYDDEQVFKLCIEKLNAYPLIFQKNIFTSVYRKKGRYRKETIKVLIMVNIYKGIKLRL